jgi:hypothetical protein
MGARLGVPRVLGVLEGGSLSSGAGAMRETLRMAGEVSQEVLEDGEGLGVPLKAICYGSARKGGD